MNTRKNNDTNVTVLLERIRVDEDDQARSQLLDVIHATLLQMARGKMRGERVDHTLGASGLVNEAYIRLSKGLASNQHRRALFGAAARAMQEILIDHARKRNARKRLGQQQREPLDDVLDDLVETMRCDVTDLNNALTRLANESERQREVVDLKFFAGQTITQIAEQLECSEFTVESDWRLARAKLYRWLRSE